MAAPSRASPVSRSTTAMIPIATAGANTRVPFHTVWLSDAAKTNWSRGTSAGHTVRRAGWSIESTVPMRKANIMMCQTWTWPVSVTVARTSVSTPAVPSANTISRRGSIRSASAPATRLTTSPGIA